MNEKILSVDVAGFLNQQMAEVFENMLRKKAQPSTDKTSPVFKERVTGSIGFGGENITGALYLHMSSTFALQMAGAMLGLPEGETPGEPDVNDAIGEMTNMLGGGLKSAFCDAGAPCAVSTPAIIRGSSFQIETVPDVRHELLVFECGDDRFAVEVHIKID